MKVVGAQHSRAGVGVGSVGFFPSYSSECLLILVRLSSYSHSSRTCKSTHECCELIESCELEESCEVVSGVTKPRSSLGREEETGSEDAGWEDETRERRGGET